MNFSNKIFSIIFASIILLSCSQANDDNPTPAPDGQTAYINGRIYTVNEDQPWAEAMIVEDGIIQMIGSNEAIQNALDPSAVSIDLNNRMVMPGIHDVHQHPLEAGSDNFQFILNENVSDPQNYKAGIASAVRQNPNAEWVLGAGFDIILFLERDIRPIDILDEVSTTQAIAIMELSSHSIWVNSKALELAGLDGNSPDPQGGIIMKDSNGEPNGLLIDNAGNLIVDLAIESIPNSEENDYFGLTDYSLPLLAQNGITSICDARAYWKRNHHETWKKVESDGRLTARVNLGLWAYPTEDDASQIAMLKSLYSNQASSLLKINQVKIYSDGLITNTTSAMQEDFLLDFFGKPTNNGLNYFTQERIASYVSQLEGDGFDFHIHAIGDRGIKEALNAFESAGSPNGRHRITHVEFTDPMDYSRFAQLNVTADCQVAGDYTNPENWGENSILVNQSLTQNVIPIKSLNQAGARVTLSSDWDVSTVNPFVGIQNAVTRAPQELSLSEAIKAYTINGAYVMRQENIVGTLEVGKEADFVVLDQNIFEVDVNRIGQTRVLQTYLKGNKIYQR